MSRGIEDIFPDVFSYPASRQEIQMSSMYEKSGTQHTRHNGKVVQDKTHTNANTHQYPHAFGHATPSIHMKCSPQQMTSSAPEVTNTNNKLADTSIIPSNTISQSHINTNHTGVILPPMRRVVKNSIQASHMALAIATLAVLNTVVFMVVPAETSPPMSTLWGSFLNIWSLITIVQLISHSVYLCTPVAIIGSLIHLAVVMISAVLIPRPLFTHWVWLAPCLCTVIVAHQSQLICLVYTHVHKQWIFVLIGCVFVLVSMIQLVQIDYSNEDMTVARCMWSAISIYTLYGFAFANSKGAVLVDVTVGASPTWQLQDE